MTSLVLVMPPQFELLGGFSTGLVSLGNYVDSKLSGLKVRVLDFSRIPLERIRENLERELADVEGGGKNLAVGISTTTASYQSALETAREFKKSWPQCTVIFGGPHASADAETILRRHIGEVDVVIAGEGEKALVQLLRTFPDFTDVPGACFLREGAYRANPHPPPLTQRELDGIPILFRDHAMGTPGKFDHVTYVSARGCPMQCSFCAVGNDAVRSKSVQRVIEDIRFLVREGYTKIAIEDNFFIHSVDRTTELCAALAALRAREGLQFTWDCQTRVESLARTDIVSLMEGSGCEAVYLGVESFNREHLAYLRKTAYPAEYLRKLFQQVVPALLSSSIACHVNLQLGIPGETESHRKFTLESVMHLGTLAARAGKKITLFPMVHVVYPGTALFMNGVESGSFPVDVFEDFTLWERDQATIRKWLGENFAHGAGGIPQGILDPVGLREGKFMILKEKIDEIGNLLADFGKVKGIEVFNYSQYLVKA